jgi:toxin ParE1/3/4
VRWTTPASEQLLAACQYIAEENPAAAAWVAGLIEKNTHLLAKHPRAGRAGRVPGTRELVIAGTPFIVAYSLAKNEIHILAVLHAARKWPDEL